MLVPFQGVTTYIPITQGVALGYRIKGFQPIVRCDSVSVEMLDEPFFILLFLCSSV